MTNPDYTMFDLLNHASRLDCQDPRDHIYAFLGHPITQLAGGSGPFIKPDYSRSTLDMYREVTTYLLNSVGLKVLVIIEHAEKSILEDFLS